MHTTDAMSLAALTEKKQKTVNTDNPELDIETQKADEVTIYTKWQLRLLSSVASCYIKRKNKWVDKDIDSFQFGRFNNSLRRKEPLCCKSQEEETVVNSWAGIRGPVDFGGRNN